MINLGQYPKEQGRYEAIFQLMMLAYNLFLLFTCACGTGAGKMEFASSK